MPNWCDTHYRILGDKDQIDELYKAIEHLKSLPEPLVKNGFGKLWLGCLVNYLGGDWQKVNCRGEITDYMRYEESLDIYTMTAWAECNEVRAFLEDKFPGLKIYYISEEPGMCEYYTNDRSGIIFYTKYMLYIEDILDQDYYLTLQEVAEAINDLGIEGLHVEPTEESIRNVLSDYEESHDDFYYSFEKFQIDN